MKDATTGREMGRLGDSTDHSGEVIEAASNLTHLGVGVALDGHLVKCPDCGGAWPIIATGRNHACRSPRRAHWRQDRMRGHTHPGVMNL